MKTICVYCGSNYGRDQSYAEHVKQLALSLAERQLHLVYGGARVGLMGVLADAMLAAGGLVTGVIPEALVEKELAHTGLTDLRIVKSMHERKALMCELADGFIAFPGGLGTLEELFEMLTWAQLGLHKKPCGLLNINDFYTPLTAFLEHAAAEQFITQEHRAMLAVASSAQELLDQFLHYQAPAAEKLLR